MAPLLAERLVAAPVEQGQSLAVDLETPRAKVQYERREDRAGDPTAPADSRAREDRKKRRIVGVGPGTVGE